MRAMMSTRRHERPTQPGGCGGDDRLASWALSEARRILGETEPKTTDLPWHKLDLTGLGCPECSLAESLARAIETMEGM